MRLFYAMQTNNFWRAGRFVLPCNVSGTPERVGGLGSPLDTGMGQNVNEKIRCNPRESILRLSHMSDYNPPMSPLGQHMFITASTAVLLGSDRPYRPGRDMINCFEVVP